MVLTRSSATMSASFRYVANLSCDAEEVDLSTFELIEDLDDDSWKKLEMNKKIKRFLPPSLLTIRYNAFRDCEQLTDVTIPSSLESIEGYAFCDCSALAMRDFKLPYTLEELGSFAFRVCSGLAGK
jgi:hypothetical protein